MGLFTFGIPRQLVLALARDFGIRDFVETGTFRGDTAAWAAEHFENVHTVEAAESLYREAQARYRTCSNIEFHFGDSPARLPEIISRVRPPALFWLDAHWCSGESAGGDNQCPLLDELAIINRTGEDHFILVDDARLFTAPPPHDHVAEQWPTIGEICESLNGGRSNRYTVIQDDVIISIPAHASDSLWQFFKGDPSRIHGRLELAALSLARHAKRAGRRFGQ